MSTHLSNNTEFSQLIFYGTKLQISHKQQPDKILSEEGHEIYQ